MPNHCRNPRNTLCRVGWLCACRCATCHTGERVPPPTLRDRLRAIIRDFFKDYPVGATIPDEALARYYQRLRETVEAYIN